MAANYIGPGSRVDYTATIGHASGKFILEGGFYGVAQETVLAAAKGVMQCVGVWNITVPSGTVAGDKLYADAASGVATEPTLTKTSTSNTYIGKATTARDASNNAHVMLLPAAN